MFISPCKSFFLIYRYLLMGLLIQFVQLLIRSFLFGKAVGVLSSFRHLGVCPTFVPSVRLSFDSLIIGRERARRCRRIFTWGYLKATKYSGTSLQGISADQPYFSHRLKFCYSQYRDKYEITNRTLNYSPYRRISLPGGSLRAKVHCTHQKNK